MGKYSYKSYILPTAAFPSGAIQNQAYSTQQVVHQQPFSDFTLCT